MEHACIGHSYSLVHINLLLFPPQATAAIARPWPQGGPFARCRYTGRRTRALLHANDALFCCVARSFIWFWDVPRYTTSTCSRSTGNKVKIVYSSEVICYGTVQRKYVL